MSDNTGIEWTEATWNPVTGCTKVSAGCARCYISRTPPFRMAGRDWDARGHIPLLFHEERLDHPLRWTRSRMIFVNSLSDLFHEDIPYEFVREVFNIMRRCDGSTVAATGRRNPSHIFQVLTKRPERALELWQQRKLGFSGWPKHIWLGVSVENARFTWRADVLREIPSPIRFLSCEPLLGSLFPEAHRIDVRVHDQDGHIIPGRYPLDLSGIGWVIAGGESGPGHRPVRAEWLREIRDACVVANVPFFFKQWGGRTAKAGGKELDGQEWCQMPGDLVAA